LIVCAGLWYAGRYGPTESLSSSARHIYFWKAKKRQIAAEVSGPRVLLVGGSGTLYSVRAATLETQFGFPVINLALHAGLGVDYLLWDARAVARQGDIVVLFIEPNLLAHAGHDWTVADYVVPNDLGFLLHRSPSLALDLITKLTLEELGTKLASPFRSPRLDGSALANQINSNGDLIVNQKSKMQEHHRRAIASYTVPFSAPGIQPEQRSRMIEFFNWARAHGVTVIGGFPAFLDFPEYRQEPYASYFEAVRRLYADEGIVTLGRPADFFVDRSQFFDSSYHLHDEGARAFTERVGKRLKNAVVCATAARWAAGRSGDCGFDAGPTIVDWTTAGLPKALESLEGFSDAEPWGRWTDGPEATIRFRAPLPRRFTLEFTVAHIFPSDGKSSFDVVVGDKRHRVAVPGPGLVSVDIENLGAARDVQLILPAAASPKSLGLSGDERRLGLGFRSLLVQSLD
jgi:hypothetical protein